MKTSLCILLMLATSRVAQEQNTDSAQLWNIPESISKIFAAKGLNKRYEFSFHLNPFYVRGDFNGDRRPDIAILVKEKASGKIGIAIFHSGKTDPFILGAGTKFGNGGDNFDGMDFWSVYPKRRVSRGVGQTTIPILKGEALHVGKSEAADALIYWNGKKYVWYQQGD